MNIATINTVPYLMMKFNDAKFQWLDKESLRGRLNGREAELLPLPLWVIFLIKTLPLMLLIFAVSNKFFLIREFFNLEAGPDKFIAVAAGVSLFLAIYSLFMSKGAMKIATAILAILFYLLISWVAFQIDTGAFSFQLGVGASLYLVFIIYAWWDIIMIVTDNKEMFYVKNRKKAFTFWKKNKKNTKKDLLNFQLEGIFINLYNDEDYEVYDENTH